MRILLLTIAGILILPFNLSAFESTSADLDYAVRYRDESRNRAQHRVTLKFKVNFYGGLKLIGVAKNGTSFNSSYDTFYDNSKEDKFDGAEKAIENFAFRNFYFERKTSTGLKFQVGAIPTEKGQKSITALESNGWVDGFRLNQATQYGDITVTAGSLNDPKEINAFEREREVNYIEVRLEKEVFENFVAEASYVSHDDENYGGVAGSYKVAVASDKVLKVVGEALINEDGALKASAGVKGDFMDLIFDRPSGIDFEIRTNYTDEDMGDLGTTYSSGFGTSEGHYLTLGAKKKWENGLKGYCRYRRNYDDDIEDKRFECGVSKKF